MGCGRGVGWWLWWREAARCGEARRRRGEAQQGRGGGAWRRGETRLRCREVWYEGVAVMEVRGRCLTSWRWL